MGFMGGAAGLMKAFGSNGTIGQTLGGNSSIGSSLRKPPAQMAPIATLPDWAKPATSLNQTPSWMPNFGGQQQESADGGFLQMMQRLFGPRQG
jgi:hypothetical protein